MATRDLVYQLIDELPEGLVETVYTFAQHLRARDYRAARDHFDAGLGGPPYAGEPEPASEVAIVPAAADEPAPGSTDDDALHRLMGDGLPSSGLSEWQLGEWQRLCDQATPGPWFVRYLDDSHAMNLTAVSTSEDDRHLRWPEFDHADIVAATLIQEPRYVDHGAMRWDEDAAFIAAARTALPALIAEVRRLRAT